MLNHAYEHSVREDILIKVEEMELFEAQAKALLKSPDALADIFENWRDCDSSDHMDAIEDIIKIRADEIIQVEQRRKKSDKER